MTYTYNAGSSTPGLLGVVDWPGNGGIRLNEEPGTFVLTGAPGLFDSAPDIRAAFTDLPSDDGAFAGTPFYNGRSFMLQGYLQVPVLADVDGAIDQLRGAFSLANTGMQTLTLNKPGWSATRQVSARVAGPVQIVEPDMLNKQLPEREFQVPMIAPDPFVYATTATTVTLDYAGTVFTIAHNGTIPTRFTVRFNGPITNPSLQFTLTGRAITYNGTIGSGNWVEVTTNPANPSGITALNQAGANVYGNLSRFDAYTIVPNTSDFTAGQKNWKVTGTSAGAGVPTVTFRDTWL